MTITKKIYFISDLHLGLDDKSIGLEREKIIVSWLDEIKHDAEELFLLGDVFDFWFEYRQVIPKGYTRFLGKLAELADAGIAIHFFIGNHDLWAKDYLVREIGMSTYREPEVFIRQGKKLFLAHGDGLGPADYKYKFLKLIFTNRFLQWVFRWLHPDIGVFLAHAWSHKSRYQYNAVKPFLGEKEWLVLYSKEQLEKEHFDYFVFGHRHFPIAYPLSEKSLYINLGDWLTQFHYACLENGTMTLKTYQTGLDWIKKSKHQKLKNNQH